MKILEITEKKPVNVTLPDGYYFGLWSGHLIDVTFDRKEYTLRVEKGTRGIIIRVVVIVLNNEVTYECLAN